MLLKSPWLFCRLALLQRLDLAESRATEVLQATQVAAASKLAAAAAELQKQQQKQLEVDNELVQLSNKLEAAHAAAQRELEANKFQV